jgi:hypothetical protein
MKRITFSLMAILTVASLSLPAFAANQNVNVLQNPMLTDTAGIAAFPTRIQSSDEHYGLAPAWEGREGDSSGIKIENYSAYVLPGINDNTD